MCVHLLRPVYTHLRKNAGAYTSVCHPLFSPMCAQKESSSLQSDDKYSPHTLVRI
jgi:hypothetical protein